MLLPLVLTSPGNHLIRKIYFLLIPISEAGGLLANSQNRWRYDEGIFGRLYGLQTETAADHEPHQGKHPADHEDHYTNTS